MTAQTDRQERVLILGYARTGRSVAEFLLARGAFVIINDRGDLSQDPSVPLYPAEKLQIVSGSHPLELLDLELDYIVKNPGIPYSIPIIQAAIHRGIPIYTDVELAYRYSPCPIIGVTGSNGKTTTTSLINQFLAERSKGKTYLGGNIGIPVLDLVPQLKSEDLLLIELSSFQLMGVDRFHPHIAVITNLFEAHLDYHGSRQAYVAAKLKLVKHLTAQDYFVYNADQEELCELSQELSAHKLPFARQHLTEEVRQEGAYYEDQAYYFKGEKILDQAEVQIPGDHNIENILAALAVAKVEGVSNEAIQRTVRHYQGEAHRIQKIATFKGRDFYNDSKSTNITASQTALRSFDQPIRYIGGGLDRGVSFDALKADLDQVCGAYLYGQAAAKMGAVFDQCQIPYQFFDDVTAASQAAFLDSQPAEVVLFSPANASWDQHENFEVRGQEFVQAIEGLIRTKGGQLSEN